MELVRIQPEVEQRAQRESSVISRSRSLEAEYASGDVELTNATSRQDMPLDGGYGWICTLAVFLINGATWGVNSVRPLDIFLEVARH